MASVSVQQMRNTLMKQYNGAWKWLEKVQTMSDNQVVAIYTRMQKSGTIR